MKSFFIALVASIFVYILVDTISYLTLLRSTTNADGRVEAAMVSSFIIGPIAALATFIATLVYVRSK